MPLEHDFNPEEENHNKEHPQIPNDQWDLPIGFMLNGAPITLNNYSGIGMYTMSERFNEKDYDSEEMKQLVLNRIRSVDNYGTFSFNKVRVDREMAIKEVEEGTELGDYIIEIEMETITAMIEVLNNSSLNRE